METWLKENWFKGVLVVVFLVGGYYIFFTGRQNTQQVAEQREASKAEIVTKEFVDEYGAKVNWSEGLTYTLQAQERLITDIPTLFRGYIDDVFSRNGKTFIRFSSSFLSRVDYILELECSRSIVDTILTQKSDNGAYLRFFDEYIVVANIQEVSKPVFALEGSAFSENEVELDIESSKLFTARGTCIDIAYIGDDEVFND